MSTYRKLAYCTTGEAAKFLGVSLRTVQSWVDRGALEAWITEGGHRRIRLSSVNLLLGAHSGQAAAALSPAVAAVALPEAHAVLRILVTEDDDSLMQLYRTCIESWRLPVQVTATNNAYEALLALGSERTDLLIADICQDGVDSQRMLRHLSTSPTLEHMEIVVITPMDTTTLSAQADWPEGVHVLPRHNFMSELRQLVEQMLARRVPHQLAGGTSQ